MNDLISRQAAIDAIDRERKNKHLFNTAEDGLLEARGIINTLPSAQPKLEQNTHSERVEIDKLEVKSGKTCTDNISRQAAIDAVNKNRDSVFHDSVHYEDTVYDISNLPSAQPERKKGKWLELTNTNHTYVCSVCGRMLVNITDGKNAVTKNYPFCHCGADMRGEHDGRDS